MRHQYYEPIRHLRRPCLPSCIGHVGGVRRVIHELLFLQPLRGLFVLKLLRWDVKNTIEAWECEAVASAAGPY